MGLLDWFTAPSLPPKCFISHAYADQDIVKELVARLPKNTTPFIFPPIDVPPDQRVSDDLIEAILGCEGLIHVAGARSSESVWVSFERDYALRAGKKVYSYHPSSRQIARDRSSTIDLPLFASYSKHDNEHVNEIISFMKEKRYFDAWSDNSLGPGMDFRAAISDALEDRLARGGYVVAFISFNSLKSEYVNKELTRAAAKWPEQILPALIHPVPIYELPDALKQQTPIELYHASSGELGLNWNRIDDLIVRIYDLMWRHTVAKKTHAS